MMGDNKSEKFFKVLHDRMKEAQTDIKATVSVNVGEMTYKANEKELETGKTRTWTRLRALVASVHHAAPPIAFMEMCEYVPSDFTISCVHGELC